MREARIAVFEDRLILDAQPPVEDKVLIELAKHCAGPLPEALLALWRTAFGGHLSYDLRARFGEHESSLSFRELFFPENGGYRDLWGWIEHEESLARDAAKERGEAWPGVLKALPFGGFEYLERLYAIVTPGREHGSVHVWSEGLPPGWVFHLNEDSVTRLANDVRELFRMLVLEEDPFESDGNATGVEMLEALDELAELGTAGRTASEKLAQLVRASILDWRAAVADGSIEERPLLRRLALERAARTDDVELLTRLDSLGCNLFEKLRGNAGVLEHALAARALKVARVLLDRGAPAVGALRHGAHAVDPELARELLKRGATVDEGVIMAALNAGHVDTALVLVDALGHTPRSLGLAVCARQAALDLDQSAKRIEAGTLVSNVPSADYRSKAARLYDFANRVDPTLRR
ncbi:Ankyrin repeat protein [Archangium gephyra]|nr:Ankyrin repeat protein [Archangium gephyra]